MILSHSGATLQATLQPLVSAALCHPLLSPLLPGTAILCLLRQSWRGTGCWDGSVLIVTSEPPALTCPTHLSATGSLDLG